MRKWCNSSVRLRSHFRCIENFPANKKVKQELAAKIRNKVGNWLLIYIQNFVSEEYLSMPYFSVGRLEFLEEAEIIFREHTQVFNLVFQIRDTLYTHTECITRVDLAVNAVSVKNRRIYHTAS